MIEIKLQCLSTTRELRPLVPRDHGWMTAQQRDGQVQLFKC